MAKIVGYLLAALMVFTAAPAAAKVTTDARARYETNRGMSQWYSIEVNLLTGTELNTATGRMTYSSFKNYAVIFWGDGQASVIELSSFMMCGMEVTAGCLNTFGNLKGEDQDGDEWEICISSFCA